MKTSLKSAPSTEVLINPLSHHRIVSPIEEAKIFILIPEERHTMSSYHNTSIFILSFILLIASTANAVNIPRVLQQQQMESHDQHPPNAIPTIGNFDDLGHHDWMASPSARRNGRATRMNNRF
ncbi:unnamed protein product [Cylindrotheca closterium]|uniref:Uncharacterized protein n=1 Tax=Cylindrotheca closterium TaxID=2856 RepID=A0AAD2CIJ7_9STRA|nr:unnamed protein product [Cylindrotheca closterium]